MSADAPRVTRPEWALTAVIGLAACIGYFAPTHEALARLVIIATIADAGLIVLGAIEAFRSRSLGKLFLSASTFVFYWAEAWHLARTPVAFAMPPDLPIAGDRIDLATASLTLLALGAFQVMLYVGYALRPRIPARVRAAFDRVDRKGRTHLALRWGVGLAALLALVFTYRADPRGLRDALILGREASGAAGVFRYLYDLGLFGASLLLADAAFHRGDVKGRVGRIALAVLASVPFVVRGTRHHLLFIAVPFVVLGFLRLADHFTRKRVALVVAGGFCALLLLQIQAAVRDYGWNDLEQVNWARLLDLPYVGQFSAAIFAVHLVPQSHAYFHDFTTVDFVAHWIPSSIWPGKPFSEAFLYYNEMWLAGGSGAANVTPSAVGQFFMNWGLLGVLWAGTWLGFLAVTVDRLVAKLSTERNLVMIVVLAMTHAFIIASFRYYSSVYVTYVVFGAIVALLLTRREEHPTP